jgi:hypothetical protein
MFARVLGLDVGEQGKVSSRVSRQGLCRKVSSCEQSALRQDGNEAGSPGSNMQITIQQAAVKFGRSSRICTRG